MSMNGAYLRVTPAELERALKDPEWALDLADGIQDAQEESEPTPAEARHFTTHQTWHLLGFLLQRSGFPVDIVHGEETLTAEDWGYGPPRHLTPDRVRLAADTLQQATYDRLIQGVDPVELTEAEVYPQIWDYARRTVPVVERGVGPHASSGACL
ncbi:YfbM family protein [Streptomyces erythrochromogenes]|uniref:YfbM family protein n=1 Tax=Streptomyces erythrochromogenes TaxID=285574 RepID=UPI0036BAB038